jgi:hypothetical protein
VTTRTALDAALAKILAAALVREIRTEDGAEIRTEHIAGGGETEVHRTAVTPVAEARTRA